MKNNKLKIAYDKESGVLSVELRKARSVDSDISGNVVVDYDRKGEIVRINLYQFRFNQFRNGSRALRDFARRSATPLSLK